MLKAQSRATRGSLCGLIQGAHQLHASPLLGFEGVAVLVQGNGGVGVAQQFGECHRVHPLLQCPCCKGVAQRVEVCIRDAGPGYTAFEQILISAGLINSVYTRLG